MIINVRGKILKAKLLEQVRKDAIKKAIDEKDTDDIERLINK